MAQLGGPESPASVLWERLLSSCVPVVSAGTVESRGGLPVLRVLWDSCQLSLLSLGTRCPACLQSPTLFLGLLVSLFCTGYSELLSASYGAGRGESFIAPRASKREKEITWTKDSLCAGLSTTRYPI